MPTLSNKNHPTSNILELPSCQLTDTKLVKYNTPTPWQASLNNLTREAALTGCIFLVVDGLFILIGMPPLKTASLCGLWAGSTMRDWYKKEGEIRPPVIVTHLRVPQNPLLSTELLSQYQDLTVLDVSGNNLIDKDVTPLTKLKNLTELDISRNMISEQGARELIKIETLTTLEICDNEMPEELANAFEKAVLPDGRRISELCFLYICLGKKEDIPQICPNLLFNIATFLITEKKATKLITPFNGGLFSEPRDKSREIYEQDCKPIEYKLM